MAPRRIWFAMDAQFTFDPKIAPLGEDFGPGGPLAITHLMGVAKLQDEAGKVRMRWAGLARGAYLRSAREAREIVEAAHAEGLLDIAEQNDRGFVATFTSWASWQSDPTAAERQARKRSRQRHGDVTETSRNGHAESRDKNGQQGPNVTRDSRTVDSSTPIGPPAEVSPTIEQQAQDFATWLAHHEQVTKQTPPKPGTKARAHIAEMFGARRAEKYSLDDLKYATVGAYTDKNRNENGWYDAESVLRPTKVHKLIQAGKRHMGNQRKGDTPEDTQRRLAEAEK